MRKIDKDGFILCELQAKAFEMSATMSLTSSEIFIRRFMNSQITKSLDSGDVLQTNIQAKDVLERIEEQYGSSEYGSVKYTENELYWIGYIYRYWHYVTGESSKEIYKQAPVKIMKKNYEKLYMMTPEEVIYLLKESN